MPIEKPHNQAGIVNPIFGRGFLPTVGGFLMVSLPNELARSQVIELTSHDVVIVKLLGPLMTQVGHTYNAGDIVACERAVDAVIGKEIWRPVDERHYQERRAHQLAEEAVSRREPPAEFDSGTAAERSGGGGSCGSRAGGGREGGEPVNEHGNTLTHNLLSSTSPIALKADGKVRKPPHGYAVVDIKRVDGSTARVRLPLRLDEQTVSGESDIAEFRLVTMQTA